MNAEHSQAARDAVKAFELGEQIAGVVSDALSDLAGTLAGKLVWGGLASGVGLSVGAVLVQLVEEQPRINQASALDDLFRLARETAEQVLADKELRGELVRAGRKAAGLRQAAGNN